MEETFYGVYNDGIRVFVYRGWVPEDNGEKIFSDEIEFKEVSPQVLAEEIEKQKCRIRKELDGLWNKYIAPFMGQPYEENIKRATSQIFKIKPYFETFEDVHVLVGPIINDYELDWQDFQKIADILRTGKYHVPEDRIVIGEPCMEYDMDCEDDNPYLNSFAFALPVLVVRKASESKIKKFAMEQAVYNLIGRVFILDCDAIQAFIDGDLTFKGLIKRIDPRVERSC